MLFGFLASCIQTNAAISLVVHKVAKDLTGAESTALLSPGYESRAGNFIAVWIVTYSGAEPAGLLTDSAGDVFKPATLRNGTWNGQWFYAANVKGDGFNIITARPKTTGRATFKYPAMIVLEYEGVDKAAPPVVDAAGEQGSLTGSWTSAAFNAAAGELVLLGIVTANGGNYTAGPGFKLEDSYLTPNSTKFSFAAFDQVLSAAQSGGAASVSWSGTYQTTGAVVSFKPASQ
jgi:hypothetical protein